MKSDYHEVTLSKMCAVGQSLRMQALSNAGRINNMAWNRATATDRSEMIRGAKDACGDAYALAWEEWQAHYSKCKTCQAALK